VAKAAEKFVCDYGVMDRMVFFFISTEENLEQAFGKEYLDYKGGVRRWI